MLLNESRDLYTEFIIIKNTHNLSIYQQVSV